MNDLELEGLKLIVDRGLFHLQHSRYSQTLCLCIYGLDDLPDTPLLLGCVVESDAEAVVLPYHYFEIPLLFSQIENGLKQVQFSCLSTKRQYHSVVWPSLWRWT